MRIKARRLPKSPMKLMARAKQEWKRIVPLLLERNDLSREDLMLLAGYCNAIAVYEQALQVIEDEGVVYMAYSAAGKPMKKMQHPATYLMIQSQRTINDIAKRFGFSPLDRQRLPDDVDPEEDRPTLRELLAAEA